MATGIRVRHIVLKACTAIVKIPNYGPERKDKGLWLRLDLNGEVIITDPVWQLLQQHAPGELELLNTVAAPPTQHVSNDLPGLSDADVAAHRQHLAQQAQALNDHRAKVGAAGHAAIELAPAGATTVHIAGADPTTSRPRITLT